VRRLSIIDGSFRALIRQHASSVELQLDSKQSGDSYAKELPRGGFPSCRGMLDEPSQMFEFLVQALEAAQLHPGVSLSDTSYEDAGKGSGLKCYVCETSDGAQVKALLRPQFAFVRPVEVSLELPKVALATMQQKIAIQLQTQASMSQQLLAEQMVAFGKQVKEQGKQFEHHVAEKLQEQLRLVVAQGEKLQSRLETSEKAIDTELAQHKETLKGELAAADKGLQELMAQEMDSLRQELQLQLQLVRAEVGQVAQQVSMLKEEMEDDKAELLPRGVYFVHVKGWEEPGRPAVSALRSNAKPAGGSTTLFRVWTSGGLTEDELWMVLHSELLKRRRQQQQYGSTPMASLNSGKNKVLRRIEIEPETEEHRAELSGGKIGKKRLSSGSVTESGHLTLEFIFP